MTKEDYIMVDIHPNNMKEKNYNLRGMALSNFLGTVDLATNQRVIEKQEFLGQLKEVLKLSKYKCKVIIQTFIDLNIIEEDNKYYYINPVSSNFLKLVVPTAKYCINNLSDFCFKVYNVVKGTEVVVEEKDYTMEYSNGEYTITYKISDPNWTPYY